MWWFPVPDAVISVICLIGFCLFVYYYAREMPQGYAVAYSITVAAAFSFIGLTAHYHFDPRAHGSMLIGVVFIVLSIIIGALSEVHCKRQ
jgi:hypothetical protein